MEAASVEESEVPGEELEACPFQATLEVLGRRHALGILRALQTREAWRFRELEEALGVNPKTLTSRLREMEAHGLLERRAYAEVPPRVEYRLSAKGSDLHPIFEVLEGWHRRYEE